MHRQLLWLAGLSFALSACAEEGGETPAAPVAVAQEQSAPAPQTIPAPATAETAPPTAGEEGKLKREAHEWVDQTKSLGGAAWEATKETGGTLWGKTKELGGEVADQGKALYDGAKEKAKEAYEGSKQEMEEREGLPPSYESN